MKELHIDYCDRFFFDSAVEILSGLYPKVEFKIKLVYFDFGQNWMHETIIADRKDGTGGWQVPCPRDWKLIQKGDILQAIENIEKQQENLFTR